MTEIKMPPKKYWLILLVMLNVLILFVMHLLTQQWTYVMGMYRTKPIDKDIEQSYVQSERFLKVKNFVKLTSPNPITENYRSRHSVGNGLNPDGINLQIPQDKSLRDPKDFESIHKGINNMSYEQIFLHALEERNRVLQGVVRNHRDKCFSNCDGRLEVNRLPSYTFLQSDFKVNETLFSVFKENRTTFKCDSKIQIHHKHFALVQEVTLHLYKWQANGLIEAGKKLHTFKSHELRTDEAEVLKPVKGLLGIQCPGKYAVTFDNETLENVLMIKYLMIHKEKHVHKMDNKNEISEAFDYEGRFTVAIQRGDYANFYHVMLHMHSIFVMLLVFHQQPVNITILVLDAHPQAEIDDMLETLYGPLLRVTKLKKDVKFKNLVLSLKEGQNLLSKYWIDSLPHLEEFRTFVYNQYLLNENHFLNCKKLTITFIWRRDKIWHPRNLKGTVQRKIFNEAEIYKIVYDKYPNICVNGLLLESIPMKEQLKFIGKTDILIGMHGAGLTHALFLPKTSGLIELFPQNFRKTFHFYKLFEVIARRRSLHYSYWENTNSENEMPNYFTRVDPVSFLSVVDGMIQKVCADNN